MIWHDDVNALGLALSPAAKQLLCAQPLIPALEKIFDQVEIHVVAQHIQTNWIREVAIRSKDQDLILAKTIVPYNLYVQHKSLLDNLGTKPIGANFLYAIPHVRSEFKYTIENGLLYRSSSFCFVGQSVLLHEKFTKTAYEI